METKKLVTPFRAIDFSGTEYDLKSIEHVVKCTSETGQETYVRGVTEYKTSTGEPVKSLGYDNFEITGKHIHVIKMNT